MPQFSIILLSKTARKLTGETGKNQSEQVVIQSWQSTVISRQRKSVLFSMNRCKSGIVSSAFAANCRLTTANLSQAALAASVTASAN
jgi:hypothetical protein